MLGQVQKSDVVCVLKVFSVKMFGPVKFISVQNICSLAGPNVRLKNCVVKTVDMNHFCTGHILQTSASCLNLQFDTLSYITLICCAEIRNDHLCCIAC